MHVCTSKGSNIDGDIEARRRSTFAGKIGGLIEETDWNA